VLAIRPYRPGDEVFDRILHRSEAADAAIGRQVADIIARVRAEGDAALVEYTRQFDRAELAAADLRVDPADLEAAARSVDEDFLTAITNARANIRRFHEYQKQSGYVHDDGEGVLLGKRVLPLASAGVYCPGGTAPLFSSMLMNVVPAQVAGVERIAAATPPQPDGSIDPHILATAHALGLTEVYRLGSAWAVAALAYGTATVAAVDKIVGPGNQYVAAAKRQVFGAVGIDSIAGPSEVVVICDRTAEPRFVAADLLSQVEHGSGLESGVVFTDDAQTAECIAEEVDRQLAQLSRRDAVERSLAEYGAIFLVDSLPEAVEASNRLAPEHLEIQTRDPDALLDGVTNAGAVFVGPWSPEPVGDYYCGTNHVLPTGGAARYASSLGVADFLKNISVVRYSERRLSETARHILLMAEREGLSAHANSVRIRLEPPPA
jgi:histidinol dehydrogenase